MDTLQIANPVLDAYRNEKLTQERIDFLIAQANEQLEEIAQNQEIYNDFLEQVDAPKKIDNIILWMLFMSNENICDEYIDEFDKGFREIIPVSDLADLLAYVIHLKKVEDVELDGFDYLMNYDHPGIDEMDQYCFTNVLLHVQQSKEAPMDFSF